MMSPLVAIVVYNRLDETRKTLLSFETSLQAAAEVVIVDNGSVPEVKSFLGAWCSAHPNTRLIDLPNNIGCPRALNLALAYRNPRQSFVKIDNDVTLASPQDWIEKLLILEAAYERAMHTLALISAYYEPWQQQRIVAHSAYENLPLWYIRPIVGHCVWHTGAFMDKVGYFDVLAPNHLYGFEDLIMSHKATCLEMGMVAWKGWHIANIQRHSAIGTREQRDAHVAAMRPLYNARARGISRESIYTGPNGEPS